MTSKQRKRHKPRHQAARRFAIELLEQRRVLAATAFAETLGGDANTTVGDQPTRLLMNVDQVSVSEATGPDAAVLRITRHGDTDASMVATLTSDDETELYVPGSVTFPPGVTTVELGVSTQNDFHIDGAQTAKVSVSAEGYVGDSVSLIVLDDDTSGERTIGGRVSGTLPADTYSATFDVEVPGGMVWTIEPSTTIQFELGTALRVEGTLIAAAQHGREIVLTSAQSPTIPGDWAGIRITGAGDSQSIFSHVEIAYAKTGIANQTNRPNVTIENSQIHHNLEVGVAIFEVADQGASLDALNVLDNRVRDNGWPAVNAGLATAFAGPVVEDASDEPLAFAESTMPSVSIDDAQVIEGHAGTTTLSFNVTLDQLPTSAVDVDVTVSNDSASALVVERVASGLSGTVFVTAAPGQPNLLYIVEKTGQIQILDLQTGMIQATPFLSIPASEIVTGGERGLLGLAFHPDYETNRLFYIYMTERVGGASLIRQYQANVGGLTADPSSATRILGFPQPFGNHNGGWIGFGPDGFLYIASGDGGGGNDPDENGQDLTDSLLGKMLRIDVDGDDFLSDVNRNYAIPSSNPFVGIPGDDEIWAYGLRNPWRSSFDRQTGDLYIADVGQGQREEINVQPADSAGGENYGWRLREGTIQTPIVGGPKPPGAIDPIYDYRHASGPFDGFSVTGGYVYRGPIAELQGNYFFADYVSKKIWSLRYNGDAPTTFDGTNYTDLTDWTSLLVPDVGTIDNISSFGEDAAGNLYIIELGGEIFRISQGADYVMATSTLRFRAGVTEQTFEVEILGDRLPEPGETLTVTLSNVINAAIGDGQATGTILNDDPPKVESVVINGGDAQRSVVDEVTVTFDSIVEINETTGNAFAFTNLDTSDPVDYTESVSVATGKTVVTFNFVVGPSVESRGSKLPTLAGGNYELTIDGSRIGLGGISLDGDADGTAGGNHVFVDEFFRKHGDFNGNNMVDLLDFASFRRTFGLAAGDDQYLDPFDTNANDLIDLLDFAEFRRGFGQ